MRARARRTNRPGDYGPGHRRFLLNGGVVFASEAPGFFPPAAIVGTYQNVDREALREAWAALGDEITAEWVMSHPGTRPQAWWEFSAPERRRRLISGGPLYVDLPTTHPSSKRFWFGIPCVWSAVRCPVVFETEAAYLDRHGLLSVDERIALGDDWERTETHFPWAGEIHRQEREASS